MAFAVIVIEAGDFANIQPNAAEIPVGWSSNEHVGKNRATGICLIDAENDLAAVQAYLMRYRDKTKTFRSYKKELERFCIWCATERKVALSDVLSSDCEAYKDFLSQIKPQWVGAWAPRTSPRWRPFNKQLSPASQQYAIQTVKACFEWLVAVRYLSGNPWRAATGVVLEEKELALDIDKALPADLWHILSGQDGVLDRICVQNSVAGELLHARSEARLAAQNRLTRAAIYLMGFAGLRRAEVCGATRNNLTFIPGSDVWQLKILGKRNKWRTVFLPSRAIQAIKAHWADLGQDFDRPAESSNALLSPVVVVHAPNTASKHLYLSNGVPARTGLGLTPDALYQLVKRLLKSLATNPDLPLIDEHRKVLLRTSPHAFRHTYGTLAAAKKMPLDVLQKLMGHTSLQTTSIYVQAEKIRQIQEASKFFEEN